jgi:hypothetical protein
MAEEKPIKIERQEIDKPSLEREGSVDDEKSALELKHKNEREELGNRLQKSKSAAGFLVILLVAPARVVGGLLVGEGDVKHFARDGFYFLYQAPSVSQKIPDGPGEGALDFTDRIDSVHEASLSNILSISRCGRLIDPATIL